MQTTESLESKPLIWAEQSPHIINSPNANPTRNVQDVEGTLFY